MDKIETNFKDRVEDLVAQIPPGRVMTYGQIAALCGNPRAARIVGGIAHFGDPELAWQRVVNKHGGLAAGYPGGRAAHAQHLLQEGVEITDERVAHMTTTLWYPNRLDHGKN